MVESSIEVDGISLEYHGFKVRGVFRPILKMSFLALKEIQLKIRKGETVVQWGIMGLENLLSSESNGRSS